MSVVASRYRELAERYCVTPAPRGLPTVTRPGTGQRPPAPSPMDTLASPIPPHTSGFRPRNLTSPTPIRNAFTSITLRSRQVRSARQRQFIETCVSGSAAPKSEKPRTAGIMALRKRQEMRQSNNGKYGAASADDRKENSANLPDAHVLQPQVRYDPIVVGEVGPDRSTIPKNSVHLHQSLNVIPDAGIIKELMTSFQVRPISGTLSVKTENAGFKRSQTWPRIRVSSASRDRPLHHQNTEETRKDGKKHVVWAPEIERVTFISDLQEAGSPNSTQRDSSDETAEGERADTFMEMSTSRIILTHKNSKQSQTVAPYADGKSYDMRRQKANRHTLPVCRVGLLEKRSRDSPSRVIAPPTQSLSPYLPNYRPEGGRACHMTSPGPHSTIDFADTRPITAKDRSQRAGPPGHITAPPSKMTVLTARSRPQTGVRRQSSRAGRPHSSKYRADKYARPEGSLYVRVSVRDVDMPHPVNGTSWLRAYQNKELVFYTAVLRDEGLYIEQLSALPDFADIEIKTLSVGSLVIQMQCHSQEALQRLEKLYRKRLLKKIVNQVLVNADLMEEMGVKNLILDTLIEPADFERCRRELRIVDIDKTIQQEVGFNLEDKDVEKPNFMSRLDCAASFQSILDDFNRHIASLDGRQQNISSCRREFLMTLKLAKPVDIKVFCTLDDVISVHRYLRASPSVGKTVNTELVTDFLSIVNISRLKLSDLLTKVKAFEGHVLKYVDNAMLDSIYQTVDEVTQVLDPSFNFTEIPLDGGVQLGIMDGKMFSKLVLYIPHLFEKLESVSDSLKLTTEALFMATVKGEGSVVREMPSSVAPPAKIQNDTLPPVIGSKDIYVPIGE